MSGKGKRKSKKKDNIKPKAKEIKLFEGCIDLERFAYDVIKYTALKFHVPESCIAVWKDKCNDYGCDDFLLVVCMEILGNQIIFRHLYHEYFSQEYEENKLATPDFIGTLLFKVIRVVTRDFSIPPLSIVLISLSIACELFLFLYSKDMDLYPKKLAKTWYECYLNIKSNKKDFEAEGGVQELYVRSYCSKSDVVDAFFNKFIEAHCLPYHTTACNPDLKKLFRQLAIKARYAYLSLSQKDTEIELKLFCEAFDRLASFKIIETPSPDGTTGFNPPETTVTPHVSFAAASQELPPTIPEVQPWLLRNLSLEERKKKLKMKTPFQQDIRRLILDSLGNQSSDEESNVLTAAAQSYGHQRAVRKDRVQDAGSSDLQTEPFKQGIRQSILDSVVKQPSDQKILTVTGAAQSYEHQGAESKDRVQNTGSSDLQMGLFEQGIRQFKLVSSGTKESRHLTPKATIATGAAKSYENQGAEHNGRVQNTGSSDLQTGDSNGTGEDGTEE